MQFVPKGIHRQILILTFVLVTGASVIIGTTSLFVFYEYSRDTALKHNQEIARFFAGEVSAFVEEAIASNESVAAKVDVNYQCKKGSNYLAKYMNTAGIFDSLYLMRSDGTVTHAYSRSHLNNEEFTSHRWFNTVLKNDRTVLSEPFLNKSGKGILVVASPVKDRFGKNVGILAGVIQLQQNAKLKGLMSAVKIGRTGYTYLLDHSGNYIYHPQEEQITMHARYNQVTKQVVAGKSGYAEVTNVKGISMLAGYTPVPGTDWGLVIELPLKEALISAMALRNVLLLIVGLMWLLVLVGTYLEVKRIVFPLTELIHGVERVASGDYTFNVEVNNRNEIGTLARAFNLMVTKIKNMREEISEKQQQLQDKNEELHFLAITDGLTKLYNHRYFQEMLQNVVAEARGTAQPVALIILDVDYFKYYNDLFGHQAGDKILYQLGQVIKKCLRPNDFLARYGGEEFAVIMEGLTSEEAFKRAEFIRKTIEEYDFEGGEQQPDGRITVSIGLATFPYNAQSKEELIKMADEALYKAKCFSRNKVELYFSVLDELKADLNRSDVELINSLKMLVRIVNAKDKYTYGHSERVSRYAVELAQDMGLSPEEIKHIKIGGFLHDIGKIEVSRNLLTKRVNLTSEERDILKKHPMWGAAIIKAIEALSPTLPIIKFHHERYDGSGYPSGLTGVEIPIGARIIAVADSFDAMTSNRPYRKRMTFQQARLEIEANAGKLYDPDVVKALSRTLDTGILAVTDQR